MSNKEPLIIVVGRTASGKDTFINQIKADERTMAISHTTRPKRIGEGHTHIFIDSIDDYTDRILETTINGYHYFLTKEDLEVHDILLVDPRGVRDLMALEDFNRPFIIYYLDVDRDTRRERYMNRDGASFADFTKRDFSEDVQFMLFEEFISLPETRVKYGVRVLSNNRDIINEVSRINERV